MKLNVFRLPSVIWHLYKFLIVSACQPCSNCFYKRNVISLSASWPEFSKWNTVLLTDVESLVPACLVEVLSSLGGAHSVPALRAECVEISLTNSF